MAGLGRRTHYRKHLTDSILHDLPEPNFKEGERVGKVVNTRGGNQFDVIVVDDFDQAFNGGGAVDGGGDGGATANNGEGDSQIGPDKSTRRPPPASVPSASTATVTAAEEQQRQLHPQLAILPTKFHKLVWVKRGDFVIVQIGMPSNTNATASAAAMATPSNDGNVSNSCNDNHDKKESDKDVDQTSSSTTPSAAVTNDNDDVGNGIRLMITHILYKDQVKHLKSKGLWPEHPEFVTGTDVDALEGENCEQPQKQQGQEQKDTYDDGIVYNDYFNNNNNDSNEYGEYDDENDDYDYDEYDNSNDDDLFVNTNRLARLEVQDSGSDSDSSDDAE